MKARVIYDSVLGNDAIAFVPTADNLFELIDNQVRAAGVGPGAKSITLKYGPMHQWSVDIEYRDCSTHARRQYSVGPRLNRSHIAGHHWPSAP
jgi:hypothetical protein